MVRGIIYFIGGLLIINGFGPGRGGLFILGVAIILLNAVTTPQEIED
jgi:hypothetical protein